MDIELLSPDKVSQYLRTGDKWTDKDLRSVRCCIADHQSTSDSKKKVHFMGRDLDAAKSIALKLFNYLNVQTVGIGSDAEAI